MNNKKIKRIITSLILLLFGIFLLFNPELTEYKFGISYPYNLVIGSLYIIVCFVIIVYNYKKLNEH